MNKKDLPYKNPRLTVGERVDDLMSRMTPKQKLAQLQCTIAIYGYDMPFQKIMPDGIGVIGVAPAGCTKAEGNADMIRKVQEYLVEETELGIPALFHCEALSGPVFSEGMVFPVAIGLASTWDPDKLEKMSDISRKQMMAVGFRHALSPNLDICRDPRWGRIGESYGEDPTLASAMGSSFIKGLQALDENGCVAATGKHFMCYSNPESGLNQAPAHLSHREVMEVHAKPFQAAFTDAGLLTIMNSYGAINGEPVTSSYKYLTEILREKMGFKGVVVSDYSAIERLLDPCFTAADISEAGLQSLKAGLDVEMPLIRGYDINILEAVEAGQLDDSIFENSVRRVLKLKFRMGLFENPYPLKFTIPKVFNQPEDEALNIETARESIILLKNDKSILPLSKKQGKVAIIGPHSDSIRALFGCYTYPALFELASYNTNRGMAGLAELADIVKETGAVRKDERQFHPLAPIPGAEEVPELQKVLHEMYPKTLTIKEAIQKLLPDVQVTAVQGCTYMGKDRSGFEAAVKAALEADVVILTLGGKNGFGASCTIGEGIDACNLGLPGVQEELARCIAETGKPTVVVHMDGRPLSSEYIVDAFPAIIEAWQPGIFGGEAIASVLFGDYNPGGKLPATAVRYSGQLPVYYSMKNGAGYMGQGSTAVCNEGYVDGTSRPLYWFGHGLSYTTFEYDKLILSSKEIAGHGSMYAEFTLRNTGLRAGDEVVQLYIKDKVASLIRPVKELVGFRRIHLEPGESKRICFTWKLSQIAFLDVDMRWKVEAGDMEVQVGSSSDDIRLVKNFRISTDAYPEGRSRTFVAESEILTE